MRILWHGTWTDVPGYNASNPGVPIAVDAAVPLWRIERASARPTRRPLRKVVVFLLTDGPRSTLRKARTKRDEPKFSGDYWVSLLLGRSVPANRPAVALGLRVPPAAEQLVVHRSLLHEIHTQPTDEDLVAAGARFCAYRTEIEHQARQNYLYSEMEPPDELLLRWREVVEASGFAGPAQPTSERPPVAAPRDLLLLRAPAEVPSRPNAGLAEPATSLVIRPAASSPQAADTLLRMPRPKKRRGRPAALLGAGDYGRTEIIPALRAAGFSLQVVADRDPQIAALVAKRYGFNAATTDPRRAIDDLPLGGLAIVATAHDSHADLACRAAEAGHRVFLEKPPAVSPSDVARLASVMAAFPGAVEIGFNRRYHPLVRRVRSALATERGPMSAVCTVKELGFNPDHWYFWDNQGTRLTGNLCHWIDLMVSLLDGRPLPVSLTLSPRIANRASDDDERVLTVTFEDGSLFTVLGTNRGDDIRGVQEQLQIHKGHTTVIFDDMWKLRVRRGGLERYSRTLFRTKAHSQMYRTAFKRVLADEPSTYTIEDLAIVSAIQIAASTLVHGDQSAGEIPHWLHSVLDANASRAAAEMIDLPV